MHIRRLTVGATAVAAAGLMALAPTATAATVFNLGGTGSLIWGDPGPWHLPYTDGEPETTILYPSSPVEMDWSISVGADLLQQAWASTPGAKITVGISQGGLVIAEVKRRLMALPEDQRPGPDELTFFCVGDPSNPLGGMFRALEVGYELPILGVTVKLTPDTPWDTVYITREYDGFADFPDRVGNLVAVANALLGIIYVHARVDYADVDLTTVPGSDVTRTINSLGATITTYLVRTESLPLVQPLRDLGLNEDFVAKLEARLKPIVDAGYSRNDGLTEPEGDGAPDRHEVERSNPRIPRVVRLLGNLAESDSAAEGESEATGRSEGATPRHRAARLGQLRGTLNAADGAAENAHGDARGRARVTKRELGSRPGHARAVRGESAPAADGPGDSDHTAGADD